MLSKIGNVTIQRLPLKQDDTDKIEKPSTDSKPSPPALETLQLPKLPSSINITIKSSNVSFDSTKNEQETVVEREELRESKSDSDSDYSENAPTTDEENPETETCDKMESAQDDSKSHEIVGETTNLSEKVDLDGLAAVEMLQSAAIIEELPIIKEELMDAEEFQRTQLETGDSEEASVVAENELSKDTICKEDEYSDDEGEIEAEEENESEEADNEQEDQQPDEKATRKKKRKPKSKDEDKESKKQKTSQGRFTS